MCQNIKCHLSATQCNYYIRQNQKSIDYWNSLSAEQIASKRNEFYTSGQSGIEHANPTSILIDTKDGHTKRLFTGEKYPSSKSIEIRNWKEQVPVDLPTFIENLGMLDENIMDSENPFQPLLQEIQEMKESKMIDDQDITDMSKGTVSPLDLLIQRQLSSGTPMQEQLYKHKKEKWQKIWDKVVDEVTTSQKKIVRSAASQLKRNKDANRVNETKVAKKLDVSKQAVHDSLKRVKKNVDWNRVINGEI